MQTSEPLPLQFPMHPLHLLRVICLPKCVPCSGLLFTIPLSPVLARACAGIGVQCGSTPRIGDGGTVTLSTNSAVAIAHGSMSRPCFPTSDVPFSNQVVNALIAHHNHVEVFWAERSVVHPDSIRVVGVNPASVDYASSHVPTVSDFFPSPLCTASVVIRRGWDRRVLSQPFHLIYSAISCYHRLDKNKSIAALLTHWTVPRLVDWYGTIVILKFSSVDCYDYTDFVDDDILDIVYYFSCST
ncbi:hypothetical protein LXA43DRAFT_1068552 [Ganoderma leucocontextum]|nr:hypothetical protein LXA43DRAFT_1068552 [Ganoderma leucocontextum]